MIRKILAFSLVIGFLFTPTASSTDLSFSQCLLTRSTQQIISLGAPLSPERLGNKSRVKIGVLPFHFLDSRGSTLTAAEKSNYQKAAQVVEELSDGIVKIDLVFYPIVNSKMRYQQAVDMNQQSNVGWNNWDLTKSTFGIVKEIVKNVDPLLDFSNIDGVILYNKSQFMGGAAEAFQFFQSPPDLAVIKNGIEAGLNFSFHESMKTQEGFIHNAILLDGEINYLTIAHEILHNFGLTDLYGGATQPPSIMAVNTATLLNYEKAVLGWFPIDRIKCVNFVDIARQSLNKNEFMIDDVKKEYLVIIKVNDDEAYVFEVRQLFDAPVLIFYSIRNLNRPPITMMYPQDGDRNLILSLNDPTAIGRSLTSTDLRVMITNLVGEGVKLHLIPTTKVDSQEFQILKVEADRNREQSLALAKAAKNKAAMNKKITIICVKGKLMKKVTAVKPKCPSGYKKK